MNTCWKCGRPLATGTIECEYGCASRMTEEETEKFALLLVRLAKRRRLDWSKVRSIADVICVLSTLFGEASIQTRTRRKHWTGFWNPERTAKRDSRITHFSPSTRMRPRPKNADSLKHRRHRGDGDWDENAKGRQNEFTQHAARNAFRRGAGNPRSTERFRMDHFSRGGNLERRRLLAEISPRLRLASAQTKTNRRQSVRTAGHSRHLS